MHFERSKLTDSEITVLAIQLKADPNSKVIKDQLIMAFLVPASAIASKYHGLTGLGADDLQGEALLGVVEAVNRFHKIKHDNIGGYINKYVHQYCRRFIKRFSWKTIPLIDSLCGKNEFFDSIIMFDILDSIVKTEAERQIIELRIEGLNDAQIETVLGLSRHHIWSIRKTLFSRYRRLSSV